MCSDAKEKKEEKNRSCRKKVLLDLIFTGLFWECTCENYWNGREEGLKGRKLKSLITQLHYSERAQQFNINIMNIPYFESTKNSWKSRNNPSAQGKKYTLHPSMWSQTTIMSPKCNFNDGFMTWPVWIPASCPVTGGKGSGSELVQLIRHCQVWSKNNPKDPKLKSKQPISARWAAPISHNQPSPQRRALKRAQRRGFTPHLEGTRQRKCAKIFT